LGEILGFREIYWVKLGEISFGTVLLVFFTDFRRILQTRSPRTGIGNSSFASGPLLVDLVLFSPLLLEGG
jgi:hypothetical protein